MFGKNFTGLNISDDNIEVVEVSGTKIKNKGRIELKEGVVVRGVIKDKKFLSDALNEVFSKAKPKKIQKHNIIFSLPESITYTHVFVLENYHKKTLNEDIKTEIQTTIPEELGNLVYDFKVLSIKKGKAEIFAGGVAKDKLVNWLQFFKDNKVEIEQIDLEVLSNHRAVFPKSSKDTVLLVDIGAYTSNLAVFSKDGLSLNYQIDVGGNSFDNVISKKLKLDLIKAKKLKESKGLKDIKVKKALEADFKNLSDEILKIKKFINNKNKEEIKKIVLLGGSALMTGITEEIKSLTKIETELAVNKAVGSDLTFLTAYGTGIKNTSKDILNISIPKLSKTKVQKIGEKSLILEGNGEEKRKPGAVKINENEPSSASSYAKASAKAMEGQGKTEGSESKKRTFVLALILLGLILVFGGVLVYKTWFEKEKTDTVVLEYTNILTIEVEVPIAVTSTQFSADRVRGRLETKEIEAVSYDNALQLSKELIPELDNKEIIFGDTEIIQLADDNNYQAIWVIINEDDFTSIALNKLKEDESIPVDFILGQIIKKELLKTENEFLYLILADVEILTK